MKTPVVLLTFALLLSGCTHPGSPSPTAGKRNPAPTTSRPHQLETFTGRLALALILSPPPGPDESRYSAEIILDSPAKDAWQKIGMEIRRDSELLVGPEALRDGDRITFEGYADKLFRSDRRHRMSELKNIRIIERAPAPEPRPVPATKPTGAAMPKDSSKEPWAPPPGFGPRPDKAKPASSTHAHAPQ